MMRALALLAFAGLALTACGKRQPLEPAAGQALPPRPATSPTQPTPTDLLGQPTNYRPGRSDELLTKSAVRPDDKFDLPPH